MKNSLNTYLMLIWLVGLLLLDFVAPQILPYKPSFPYVNTILVPWGPKALYSWANFDGVHYLTIVAKGYFGTGAIQAFFPLYPLLVGLVANVFGNPITSGILISLTSLTVALYYLHKLVIIDHSSVIAKRTIWLILLFPTAFFFSALYTESLFFMLSVLCFYFVRQQRFFWAAVFAGLASATRITGIILLPAILIEMYAYYQTKPKLFHFSLLGKLIGYITIAGSGLMGFMLYLAKVFHDPLLFLHVQSSFGAGRQTDRLILLPQVFWRYAKMLVTVEPHSWLYFTVVSEFVAAVGFLVLAIMAFKKTRLSYAVYALLSYLIPTLTGTFTSLPRYVLIIFPLFLVLAQNLKGFNFKVFCLLSGILLCINTILFIQGYWVA